MPLLNYTTEVNALRSASQPSGRPSGVGFAVETPAGPRSFVLPVNPLRVEQVLRKQRVPPRYQSYDQAERVAWRILKDWIEAQLALIATEMVSLDQVMLPYMTADGGRTVYELYLDRQLALTAGDQDDDIVEPELVP